MQRQKKNRQNKPRFVRAAVLAAGIMLSACAGPQQGQAIRPQQGSEEKPRRPSKCVTIREAMQKRVGECKDSEDFGGCVFGQRMLFSTKYQSTEEMVVETSPKEDVLLEANASLMSNGMGRELIVREITSEGVLFEMRFGMRERPTVSRGQRQLVSVGGARSLEQLDRVKSGQFFYRFDGGNEDEANSQTSGMDLEIMSVERTPNGVRVTLVADIYENCFQR
jgi:hypothetical protein